MGKSAAGKMEVTDYRISYHAGVCIGPVDALLKIWIGEKIAWEGEQTSALYIEIKKPDLFGGPTKEGGCRGVVTFLPGQSDQVLFDPLAARMGRTAATAPAYRGITSLFFHGGGWSTVWNPSIKQKGFTFGSNNPYLRSIWVTVRDSPKVFADISLRMIGANANPAAIIYECLTNTDWGMGYPESMFHTEDYEACATTLLAEGFGMSLIWAQQATIEAFVQDILTHIMAVHFLDPATGKFRLKLIRADYDVEDLPVLDANSVNTVKFDRKAWEETTNEIVVTWTNPENEKEETVSAQDLGNITIQGGNVISDSRSYFGVRNKDLAMALAQRDLATASTPLAKFELTVNRTAWDYSPGDCIVLNYPEYDIEGLVLRLGKIDYGRPDSREIKVSAIEDIFSLPVSAYTLPDGTIWEDPSTEPTAMTAVKIITTPAYFTSAQLRAADTAQLAYPEVIAAILASTADALDIVNYDLIGETVIPTGDMIGEILGIKEVLGYTTLQDALVEEAVSTVTDWGTIVGGLGPIVSGFVFIGDTIEGYNEIAMLRSADLDGEWVLDRGVLDTVPRAWDAGTPAWFVTRSSNFLDSNTVRSEGETALYKLLPRTSHGVLDEDDAPVVGNEMSARPHLPNRPANVTAGGVQFGAIDLSSSPPATVAVTWSNRNRLMEDVTVLKWTDGTVVPEVGQTTTITLKNVDGEIITTHAGLTGTSFDVPVASFGPHATCDFVVTSERDSLESLQGVAIRVRWRTGGYGDNYGNDYGGSGAPVPPGTPGGGDPGGLYEPPPDYDFPPIAGNPFF